MIPFVEWFEVGDHEDVEESGWYVFDQNGIVAGPFDDDGECSWWLDKWKRV